jgi:phosphatidylserine/phosphatidylglycerophosphate/cardiolipin synthase-like enzyme
MEGAELLEMENEMTGFGIFTVFIALALLFLSFWIGAKFGGRFADRELDEERRHSATLRKQRDEARANLEIAQKNVRKAGIDARRIFPWFTCLLLLFAWPALSCAQAAHPAPTAADLLRGTSYAPGENLEAMDTTAIASAASSIDIAAYSLTDPAIVDALAAKAKQGVKVRIYLDRGELQAECRGDITCSRVALSRLIGLPGVEIRVKFSKVLMHLKSYQIDGGLVRDGSANFSQQGERGQDNSATWSTDLTVEVTFRVEFAALWNRPGNLTVADAIKAK